MSLSKNLRQRRPPGRLLVGKGRACSGEIDGYRAVIPVVRPQLHQQENGDQRNPISPASLSPPSKTGFQSTKRNNIGTNILVKSQ